MRLTTRLHLMSMLKISEAVHLLPNFMAFIKTTLPLSLPQSKYKPGNFSEIQQTGRLLQLLLRALRQNSVAAFISMCDPKDTHGRIKIYLQIIAYDFVKDEII